MIGELTPDRQWAINQGRFDMARIAWNADRSEARTILATIAAAKSFRPVGPAAPTLYRLAYRLFGFETAERIATINRITFRPSHQAVGRGLHGSPD